MNTITIWLLISIGGGSYSGKPFSLVERFATVAECQRVASVLNETMINTASYSNAKLQCVQATIVK